MSVLEAFFQNLKRGDTNSIISLIHPQAVIVGVRETPDPKMPIYGTFHGPEGMQHFLEILRSAFETELFDVETLLEDGQTGFACGRFRHKVRHTGRLFESNWALYAELEDGQLKLYRFHEDTAALEAAFGITTADKVAA